MVLRTFSFSENNIQLGTSFNTDIHNDKKFTYVLTKVCGVCLDDLGKVSSKNYSWHVLTFNLHTWTQHPGVQGLILTIYFSTMFTDTFKIKSATEAVSEGNKYCFYNVKRNP